MNLATRLFLPVILMLSTAAHGAGDEPLAIKGLSIGSKLSEAQQLVPSLQCGDPRDVSGWTWCFSGKPDVPTFAGELVLSWEVIAEGDAVALIALKFHSVSARALRASLAEKFGEPKSESGLVRSEHTWSDARGHSMVLSEVGDTARLTLELPGAKDRRLTARENNRASDM